MSDALLAPASEEARGGVSPAIEATEEGGVAADHIGVFGVFVGVQCLADLVDKK